ncbi:MAG: Squalene/phytoene synthase [uncultured bacterium]|nr:MAG: Squalene/phytoene synthase [uncultured bacterium]
MFSEIFLERQQIASFPIIMHDTHTTPTAVLNPALLYTSDSKTITRESKSSFSSSFFFLSKDKRQAIERVYAFFRVIDDVVDEEPNPHKQKEHLYFWKQQLTESIEAPSSINILNELSETIKNFHIPVDYFLKLIEGCEMDLNTKRYETFTELYEYCYRVASMVGLVCMKIFGYSSPTSDQCAIDLGMALQLTNIIRDVGTDLQKGRIYLPAEDLRHFEISDTDLQLQRTTPNYLKLMEFEYERAIKYYESGSREFVNDTENKLLAAKIMATVYRTLLEKIRAHHYPNLKYRVRLKFVQKMKILLPLLIKTV